DWAGAEAKYLAALKAAPGHVLARYNLACVYNLDGHADRGLALLVELAYAGCADCIAAVEHARLDDDWKTQWDQPTFQAVVEVATPWGTTFATDDAGAPKLSCPTGTKQAGKWDANSTGKNEIYCARNGVKEGPYRYVELGYSMGEGVLSEWGNYAGDKRTGLWHHEENYGPSTVGGYVDNQKHGLWVEMHKTDETFEVFVHGK